MEVLQSSLLLCSTLCRIRQRKSKAQASNLKARACHTRLPWLFLLTSDTSLHTLSLSIPRQGSTRLVLNHTGFKEVSLFFQINHFAHPREGVFLIGEKRFQTNLRGSPIGDIAQIAFEHGGIQAQHATRHGVLRVAVFQLNRFLKQTFNFRLKFCRPQMRVF